MVTGDGAYIKKINRSYILQMIMERGLISRAELSKITGLNKATISVQVADLLDEGLVHETQQEHNTIGRRPIMLSIHPNAGFTLGIDLDYKKIRCSVSNFKGNIVESVSETLDTYEYTEIVEILVTKIKAYVSKYSFSKYGLANAVIGIHGTVNNDQKIHFVPSYKWHNIDLKHDLEQEIDLPISIENSANLSALAEKVYQYHHSQNLMTVFFRSGIGAGIMTDGKLDKGYNGFAGEIGHMILFPGGKQCPCGAHGCWELYAAEPTLFTQLSKELNRTIDNYTDLEQLILENNPVAMKLIHAFIYHISIGLNNVINLYNPEILVLNSNILACYPNAIEEIKSNLHSNVSQYSQIALSKIGSRSTALGACALGIQHFLEIAALSLTSEEFQ
ncbi:ROK family protein [Radiobacillus sp. PE A8.2]|uniref:ROK family protein n=1 Tax=Radiobacillus sp. PE A8.2 TaxID=3380349 RepID=UPI00388DBDD3